MNGKHLASMPAKLTYSACESYACHVLHMQTYQPLTFYCAIQMSTVYSNQKTIIESSSYFGISTWSMVVETPFDGEQIQNGVDVLRVTVLAAAFNPGYRLIVNVDRLPRTHDIDLSVQRINMLLQRYPIVDGRIVRSHRMWTASNTS